MDRPKLSPLIKQTFSDREILIIERALLRLAPEDNKENLIDTYFDLTSEDGLLRYKKVSFFVNKYNVVFLFDLNE